MAPSCVTHARACCEDSAQRETNKMASESTFVGDKEIQFFCHRCHSLIWGKLLGRTFWIVTLNMGIIQVTPMMAVRIWEKSCGEDASEMSDEDFPVRRMKRFAGKKKPNYEKRVEGESVRKREKTSRKNISFEDLQRLKGSCKDCKMNVQARCEERLRID